MERKSLKKSQGGFTLIEIIAVLVILGILAAVAVPRFVNLQDEARTKAAAGGVAAVQSALSLGYAAHLLGSNTSPATPLEACGPDGVTLEQLTATCTPEGPDTWAGITSMAISVKHVDGGAAATGTWVKP